MCNYFVPVLHYPLCSLPLARNATACFVMPHAATGQHLAPYNAGTGCPVSEGRPCPPVKGSTNSTYCDRVHMGGSGGDVEVMVIWRLNVRRAPLHHADTITDVWRP